MEGWITFWKVLCTVGFSAFYILVLFVIPLGAKDLIALFRHLSRDRGTPPEGEETPTETPATQ